MSFQTSYTFFFSDFTFDCLLSRLSSAIDLTLQSFPCIHHHHHQNTHKPHRDWCGDHFLPLTCTLNHAIVPRICNHSADSGQESAGADRLGICFRHHLHHNGRIWRISSTSPPRPPLPNASDHQCTFIHLRGSASLAVAVSGDSKTFCTNKSVTFAVLCSPLRYDLCLSLFCFLEMSIHFVECFCSCLTFC